VARADRKFPNPRPLAPERKCGACGRALGQLPLNQPCPACGWRPRIHCVTCGYDLAGLDDDGACPECATPVARSIRGDGLAFADPAYLRTLDRGLGMVRWSVALVLITWIGGLLALVAISMIGLWNVPSWVEEAIVGGLLFAAMVLYAIGWWVATVADPRTPEGRDPVPGVARHGAVAILTVIALLLVLGNLLIPARQIIVPLLLVTAMAQHGAGSMHLRRLATRAANLRAARLARQAVVAVATMAVAAVLVVAVDLLGVQHPSGPGPAASWARLAFSLVRLTMLIAAIVAIARQCTAAGLLRDDLARFLAHAPKG
jgi:hypothetical protein